MSDLNEALIIAAIDKATAHPRVGGEHVCRSARVSQLIFRVTPVISFYLTMSECVPYFIERWFRAVCMLYRGRASHPMRRVT